MLIAGVAIGIVALAGYFFGISGLISMLAIIGLFFIPMYVLLGNVKIDNEEKVIFSFFLGLGLFPMIVWVINRLIYSLKISIVIAFVLIILIGIYLKRFNKN